MKLQFNSNTKNNSTLVPSILQQNKRKVIFHINHSSINNFLALFAKMFPDSKITSSMELGRTTIGYIISHGVAPYFKGKL